MASGGQASILGISIFFFRMACIDYVSLANDHALDFKESGILDTQAALRGANIKFSGAGTEKHAAMPARVSKGGLDFAFFSYSDHCAAAWKATSDVSSM